MENERINSAENGHQRPLSSASFRHGSIIARFNRSDLPTSKQRADHVRFWHLFPRKSSLNSFYEVDDGVRVRQLAARARAGLPYAYARSSPGGMTRPFPAKRRSAREAFCCPSLRRRLGRYATAGRPAVRGRPHSARVAREGRAVPTEESPYVWPESRDI